MKGSAFLALIVALHGLTACSRDQDATSAERPPLTSPHAPHIVVIIADDLGVDAGPCHSQTVRMPFLESKCAESVVFERAYAHPYCTPSRASMLTGRHTFRTGAGDVAESAPKLALDEVTLPEFIREHSAEPYRFSAFGKWHLADDANGSIRNPNLQGFDHFEGTPLQAHTYDYFDYEWVSDGAVAGRSKVYKTTKITDAVIADFESYAARGPQLYWVGHVAPHLPAHAPPEQLHSKPGLPEMTFEGVMSDNPGPGQYRVNARNPSMDPYVFAMIEALDHEIGRMVGRLDELADRPIVYVFLGDNGSAGEVYGGDISAGYRAKSTLYDGGVRVPFMIWSSAGRGLALSPGRRAGLVHLADIFPTLARIAGVQSPLQASGATVIDGVDILAEIEGGDQALRPFVYVEQGNHRRLVFAQAAIDAGGLKLILRETDREVDYTRGVLMELYDTAADPGERTNLLLEPCRVDMPRVRALLEYIANLIASEPKPYMSFDPASYRERLDKIASERACL